MRTKLVLVGMLLTAMLVNGCAAVLVGGLIYKSSKSKQEKNEFLQELNRINLEREKVGLQPLDRCVEMYHFDPGWAMASADCRAMIDSLIAADVQPDSAKVVAGTQSSR